MTRTTTLPADIARCEGVSEEGQWREGCEDCLRRTSRIEHPWQTFMAPPLIVVFECEARIAPHE